MFPKIRMVILLFSDALLVNLALISAIWVRFEGDFPILYWQPLRTVGLPYTAVILSALLIFGMYRRSWRYASINELIALTMAVISGAAINFLGGILLNHGQYYLPRSVYLLHCIFTVLLIGGSRLCWRVFCESRFSRGSNQHCCNALVIGAGEGGMMVAKELKRHYKGSVKIVGFVDSDPRKWGMLIQGIPVLGDRQKLPQLVKKFHVQEIIIAIPSASHQTIQEIVAACRLTPALVKILPGMFDLIDGNVKVSKIREVDVEDLLGRDPVHVDLAGITDYLRGQVVLVTGAGGSIGSELCRQIVRFAPQTLLLLDNCENSVYDIDMELTALCPGINIVPLVKDVRDRKSILPIFAEFRPKVVFHAAAHKHVPLMEKNPEEAVKNNVMGTYHVAEAADRFGAKRFVLVSTDKAVNPTSYMGASKRLAEMVIQFMDTISKTGFVAVRFGNVLGSRGSVVPLFKKQIAQGGPVTVTDAEMVRFFMTIPEAVQLVVQAGVMAKGGEIFVLDMGEPVKIMDLARSMIRLSGFEPGRDIEIKVTGIRPGEKLYEELLTAEEGTTATGNQRIFVAKPQPVNPLKIGEKIISRIVQGTMPQDQEDTLQMIQDFLPAFKNDQIDQDECQSVSA